MGIVFTHIVLLGEAQCNAFLFGNVRKIIKNVVRRA